MHRLKDPLSFPSVWRCATSATTGPSLWVWLMLVDPALISTLCLWTNCSWNMITSSWELFYMCSETKGEEVASSFDPNWKHFISRALIIILTVLLHRLGIWLFMSEMPYGTLSSSMLWKVLYVMQCAETAGLETLSTASDTHSCIQALRGTSMRKILLFKDLSSS